MTGFWDSLRITEIIRLNLRYKWDITVSARRMVFWNIGNVWCVSSFCSHFATTVLRTVFPRGQISVRLFYIQSNVIPILPILIYISTWIEIRDTHNNVCLWCCLRCMCGWSKRTVQWKVVAIGTGEILHLLFLPIPWISNVHGIW